MSRVRPSGLFTEALANLGFSASVHRERLPWRGLDHAADGPSWPRTIQSRPW
jgi:hypothetical protein